MIAKRSLFATLFLLATLLVPVFGAQAASPAPLPRIKVLLVPGHDNEVWGAQYGNVKEAAMNLAVASRIYNILRKDKRFEVHITRNTKGYTKEFADYFAKEQESISAFIQNAKKETQSRIQKGEFIERENPPHNKASEDVAIKLYGFNKWANENKMDAVIHIHFNDYPRESPWTIGKQTGFAIYLPEAQMANSFKSGQLSANIFMQLNKKYHTSTYQKEVGGLVPDQSLIALGSNGSLLAPVSSVLVEYGYIYEKKFRNYTTRHQAYADMAKLTVTGIKNYFLKR